MKKISYDKVVLEEVSLENLLPREATKKALKASVQMAKEEIKEWTLFLKKLNEETKTHKSSHHSS